MSFEYDLEVIKDPELDIPDVMVDPEYWIRNSLEDLFFLCTNVLTYGKQVEYRDLNWIHMELCDFLDMDKNPVPQKLVLMTRDSLKSTISRAFIIQWFLRKAYYKLPGKIGIYCGDYRLGEDNLDRITKEILANKLLQTFFGKWLPQNKNDAESWTKEKIRYNGIEIDIGSPERSLTGHHYEGVINDNLVNEINSQTYEYCKKINKRWQQQESVIAENAWEIVFETTWETFDVSGMILDPNGRFDYTRLHRKPAYKFVSKTGYAVFSCPARNEEGDPNFPEKLDEPYLARKRRKQGIYVYSRMYDLQPIPDEEVVIREPWKIHYEELPWNFIRNYVVDCAGTTRKESSYSAISGVDWDEQGRMHIHYADKRKLTPMELYRWLIELVEESEKDKRPVTFVGIEKEKYGIFLASIIEEFNPNFHVWPIDIRGRPRNNRIGALVPYYEQGRVLSRAGLRKYEEERDDYHKDKDHGVDIMDTIAYHLDIQVIPQKIAKPDFVLNIPDDAKEQFREEIKRFGSSSSRIRESINARF